MTDYDVVIVGAGPVGAILSRYLGDAGHSVLVLEAGPAVGRTWAEYEANVTQYRGAGFKVPNAPYYSPPDVPSPSVLDIRPLTPGSLPDDTGYFVQDGPLPFGTDYLRSQGGTMLHWLGTCLRMCPNDFETESRYGQGKDWPLALRRAQLLLRAGRARAGGIGQRRGPGLPRDQLPRRLRLPDAAHPAQLPGPAGGRDGRRHRGQDRRRRADDQAVQHPAGPQLDPQPRL